MFASSFRQAKTYLNYFDCYQAKLFIKKKKEKKKQTPWKFSFFNEQIFHEGDKKEEWRRRKLINNFFQYSLHKFIEKEEHKKRVQEEGKKEKVGRFSI